MLVVVQIASPPLHGVTVKNYSMSMDSKAMHNNNETIRRRRSGTHDSTSKSIMRLSQAIPSSLRQERIRITIYEPSIDSSPHPVYRNKIKSKSASVCPPTPRLAYASQPFMRLARFGRSKNPNLGNNPPHPFPKIPHSPHTCAHHIHPSKPF